ncbi:MAG: type I phosphomannose isomerase catalytic subunit [Terrimicrobiaceae bacterium]
MERVWGGVGLSRFGKKLPPGARIGEVWEMVDREDAQSVVTGGEFEGKTLNNLWLHHREEVFGAAYITHRSERFPLLVKLLDAADKLSVQVHPPAHKAQELGGEPKTEVWYFLDCTEDANIYAGLKKGITRVAFQKLLETGGVETALHEIPVRTGESIFIPSGRLHAIGAGNIIIEIQQNSDTTYRVFDWNRTGLDGKPRELHIEQSMASIDFEDFEPRVKSSTDPLVADCEYFHVEKVSLTTASRNLRPDGRFALAVSIDHPVICAGRTFGPAEFFLVPATACGMEVSPINENTHLLVCTLPTES